ncbi:MAG TPA: AAA family ATPase, partial [Anaerolineales bacterium]|nr:AAA family ATPase [Anaerolineales bacterium]
MKPLAITVSSFRGWKKEHRVLLGAPITSIIGENGRGKSSLLNAIEWCLFGSVVTKKGSGIDERQDWELRTRIEKDDIEPTVVTLELETTEGRFSITRTRSADAKQRDDGQLTIQSSNRFVLTGD